MKEQTDIFNTVNEFHHDGPKSEEENYHKADRSRPNKCIAVLKEVRNYSGYTAGEIYSDKVRFRLSLENINDIYDLRRKLYILKKKEMIRQGELKQCAVLQANTVTWFITEKGIVFLENQ